MVGIYRRCSFMSMSKCARCGATALDAAGGCNACGYPGAEHEADDRLVLADPRLQAAVAEMRRGELTPLSMPTDDQ